MATTATKIDTQWIYWKNNAGIKTNIDGFCLVLLSGFSETFIDLIMNRIYYLPIIAQRVLQKHKSNYDKMKITSIKVNLIKYFFVRNWVLKTLYSRGFTSIEVVFHCNGCIAFSGKFFSGGTSKEVRPLERGDSPRMSRRLRPVNRASICELWENMRNQ